MYPKTALEPSQTYNPEVVKLQQWLVGQGFMTQAQMNTGPGIYGNATKGAVAAYQTKYNIPTGAYSGYWGPTTIGYADNGNKAPTTQTTTPTQTTTKTDPVWKISPWQMNPDQTWKQQPILTIDGRQYTFNTPQEYVNAMNGLSGVDKYIGEFNNALPYWNSQPKTTSTPVAPAPVTPAPVNPTAPANSDLGPYAQNMTQQEIVDLQKGLMAAGYDIPTIKAGTAQPGYYGDQTKAAVAAWQKANGVTVDASSSGYWGNLSKAKLQSLGGWTAAPKNGTTPPEDGSTPPVDGGTPPEDGSTPPADGSTPNTPTTPTGGKYMYGDDSRDTNLESNAYMGVYGMMNAPQNGTSAGISKAEIDKINSNPDLLAMYVGAIAYGGYTLGDIFKDMKRREMIDSGDTSVESVVIISPTITRTDYTGTTDGQAANANPVFKDLQPAFGNIDPSIFNLPIFNMDDKMFQQLVPIMDPNSPEFKAEKEKIQSTLYDIMQIQVNAKTEQEKAAADWEYKQFTETLSKTYGIQLANDATQAWTQIENLGKQFNAQGIGNSGMQNEAVDDYLKNVRRQDDNIRDKWTTEQTNKDAKYFVNNASPEQIKALIASDPEKAKAWGLVPSNEVLDSLSLDALKAKYPNVDVATLQNMRDTVLDENGNYRSTAYQNKFNTTDNQFLDTSIVRQRDIATTNAVMENSLNKEAKAYGEFTKVGSAILGDKTSSVPGSNFAGSTGTSARTQNPDGSAYATTPPAGSKFVYDGNGQQKTIPVNDSPSYYGWSETPPTSPNPVSKPAGTVIPQTAKDAANNIIGSTPTSTTPPTATTPVTPKPVDPYDTSKFTPLQLENYNRLVGVGASKDSAYGAAKLITK